MAANSSDGSVHQLLFIRFGKKRLAKAVNNERLTQQQRNVLTFLHQCDTARDLNSIKLSFYRSVFELLLLIRSSLEETKYVLGYISHSWLPLFSLLLDPFKAYKEFLGEKDRIIAIQVLIAEILKKERSCLKRITKFFKPAESPRVVVWNKMGAEGLSTIQTLSPILHAIKLHDDGISVYIKLLYQTHIVISLINLIVQRDTNSLTSIEEILLHNMVLSGLSSLEIVILVFKESYEKIGLTISKGKCTLLLDAIKKVVEKKKN